MSALGRYQPVSIQPGERLETARSGRSVSRLWMPALISTVPRFRLWLLLLLAPPFFLGWPLEFEVVPSVERHEHYYHQDHHEDQCGFHRLRPLSVAIVRAGDEQKQTVSSFDLIADSHGIDVLKKRDHLTVC